MKAFDPKPVFAATTIILVNPNPTRSYRAAYSAQSVTFEPLQPVEVPKQVAEHFLYKAHQAKTNSEIMYKDTQRAYLMLAGSGKQVDKMKAAKYLDSNGELAAAKWDMPPLVDLGTEQGKEMYEKGLALKEKMDAGEVQRQDDSPIVNEHELTEPKETWSRDKLREYLRERNVTFGNSEEAASLRRKATSNFLLLKETLEAANVKVRVV